MNSELSKFKFYISDKVKFAEVDSFGVVHNVQYLYWIEWSRTEYFRNLFSEMNPKEFISEYPVMVVHAEIDYFGSALFGDSYKVFSRISLVKNSSLKFENLVISDTGVLLVKASSILVHLNNKTYQPERISDELRAKLKKFEGEDVEFINE
jgi:acyl-CoA thioester hydrolase